MQKAKKIAPPTDMDQHNAELKVEAATPPEEATVTTQTDTLTTAEAATEIGTTPRELRKFLRSANMGVGQGKRYSLTAKSVPSLKKKFDAWSKADAETRAAKIKAKAQEVNEELEQIEPPAAEVEELEELNIDEAEEPRWTRDDLEPMKVASLRDLAAELKVEGINSKSTKAQLIDAILTA